MRRAIEDINPRLGSVEQRVLIVVGDDDQLLPAAEEAKRLDKIFQRSGVRVVAGAGHSLLQEHGVDLLSIMKARAPLALVFSPCLWSAMRLR